ncbi:MAG: glycerol-3-phosphate 1-O-acyltransferase PlsY [Acholeplasmataceae bacterium]
MIYLYMFIGLVVSYLIGSIPFGFIIPKLFKNIDIREHGSFNVGSTNVVRTLGIKYGLLVFFFDFIKGTIPILLIRFLFYNLKIDLITINNQTLDIIILYGTFTALGHMFSPFINFKGGKAVATGVGVVVGINPLIGFLGIGVFALVAFITKYVSLGSIFGASSVAIMMWFSILIPWLWLPSPNLIISYEAQFINLILITLMVLLIIIKHKKNIVRLLNGTENKIGQKKKEEVNLDKNN